MARVKSYGFEVPVFVDSTTYQEYIDVYGTILERRSKRWQELRANDGIKRGYILKRFCRKGIPIEFRPEVWGLLSDASERRKKNPDVYKISASKLPEEKLLHVIIADVPRTYPENEYFRNLTEKSSKTDSLRKILVAFAVYHPEVGYCQGFNYVAASLMLAMPPTMPADELEEQVFWLLDALIIHILPPYYSSDMIDTQVDCLVFGELLKIKLPQVYQRLEESNVSCIILATKWFICLFADVLPIETVMRVFDCLFYEGNKILFRTSLALVKLHHDQLSQCTEFPEVITTFRDMCTDKKTLFCHDFMETMFKTIGSLPKSKIANMRSRFRAQLEAEAKATEAKRAAFKVNNSS